MLDSEASPLKESVSLESPRSLQPCSHQLKRRVGRKTEWFLKNEPVVSLGVQIPAGGWILGGGVRGGCRATEKTMVRLQLVSCLSESDANPNQTQPRRNTHTHQYESCTIAPVAISHDCNATLFSATLPLMLCLPHLSDAGI